MRNGAVSRKTKETGIEVSVDLDGTGLAKIATGIGFFDHMLEQLARHSLIDIEIRATGDLHIDQHHTVEDTGMALRSGGAPGLGDMAGIARFLGCTSADGRDPYASCGRYLGPGLFWSSGQNSRNLK